LNNYVTHSIATMANVLRDDPGSVGFCSANGGYITKHAFGVYSTTPPTDGFQHQDCQEEINAFPSVDLDADHIGLATVEAYTVMHGAEGPEKGLAALRTANGRQWATTNDPALMNSMMDEEHVGRSVEVLSDFTFELA
jgi:acetyl-CoA C-acetyltransferase